MKHLFGSLFRCTHKRTTFPQGKPGRCAVTCLDCGREFAYDWARMRRGAEIRPADSGETASADSGRVAEVARG